MEEIERVAILQALREHKYNRTETARALGISRRALTYKLRRFREQGHIVEPE
jgi:DNA-binding NtrC family response regulator